MRALALLSVIAGLALITATLAATGASAQPFSTSPVIWFEDTVHAPLDPVADAQSTLIRNDSGLTATMNTSGLKPGHAYTMWWVVFNNPDACENGCDGEDVGAAIMSGVNPAGIGVLYGGGVLTGGNGRLNIGSQLQVGSTAGCQTNNLFAEVCTPLTNPMDAVVVLVLHDHGPPIPGLVQEMISTFEGGCNRYIIGNTDFVVEEYGLGDYDCFSPQASVHAP